MRNFILLPILFWFLFVSPHSFGLTFEVFLKKGNKVVAISKNGGNLTVEEILFKENLPRIVLTEFLDYLSVSAKYVFRIFCFKCLQTAYRRNRAGFKIQSSHNDESGIIQGKVVFTKQGRTVLFRDTVNTFFMFNHFAQ